MASASDVTVKAVALVQKVLPYAKAAVAVGGAALAALQVAVADGVVGGSEWTTVIIAVATAALVYVVPNKQ